MVDAIAPDLNEVLHLSHAYGKDPLWIIGGGGNISLKQGNRMWIKASGMTLDSITPDGFVGMNLDALRDMVKREYPEDASLRERLAKDLLLGCRLSGEEQKRPSVETGMHALFPHRIVFHTHPTLVNGLTCARDGREWVERLFGEEVLWIPMVNPGIVLSRYLAVRLQEYSRTHAQRLPVAIFLQNHGLVVYGESADEIRSLHSWIETRILESLPEDLRKRYEGWKEEIGSDTGSPQSGSSIDPGTLGAALSAMEEFYTEPFVLTDASSLFRPFYSSRGMFAGIDGPFTPDHVVYAGHRLLWVDDVSHLKEAMQMYKIEEGGSLPRVILMKDTGVWILGQNERKARIIHLLAKDMARICTLAQQFGGVQFMPKDQTEFIRSWEVEQFRQQIT
ncbi:MAG: class II aldolase [Spirochaetales bacterium]